MCGGISMMGLFMVTAGLVSVYAIATFGPKLALQNKVKAMKAKMKEIVLTRNNQIISQDIARRRIVKNDLNSRERLQQTNNAIHFLLLDIR
jgi:hypothetical protein